MHRYLVYAAYGWLTFSGTLHFIIDVVSQYVRGKRLPGPETTLYYGLNTAFALGQVAFGLMGLWVAWRAMALFDELPAMLLAVAASFCWLAITFLFMGYREPKMNAAIFCALIVAACVTTRW